MTLALERDSEAVPLTCGIELPSSGPLAAAEGADVLIAGGRNLYTAMKARVPFLDINQEREHAYAGYVGMVEMARQLALTIENPVWSAVRKPAPWAVAKVTPSERRMMGGAHG